MRTYTEIVVLLDRSGSMEDARADHEGGLNSFVRAQKQLSGDVLFTLIQFDSQEPCEVVYDGVPVAKVGQCKLNPRGSTPLLDAVGLSVAHLRARLDGKKPDQVIFMVITDGLENASREYTKERVKRLIAEQEAAGWRFLFLGANIDAFAEGGDLGVSQATTGNFRNDAAGTKALYKAVSANVARAQQAAAAGAPIAEAYEELAFSPAQRSEMSGE